MPSSKKTAKKGHIRKPSARKKKAAKKLTMLDAAIIGATTPPFGGI